jgi:hypothetical protein
MPRGAVARKGMQGHQWRESTARSERLPAALELEGWRSTWPDTVYSSVQKRMQFSFLEELISFNFDRNSKKKYTNIYNTK